MNGFINILKPPGMTSAAVVATLRRLCAGEKAGHAGTLDPEAAGVLPVMMGRAARLFDYLVDKQKEYVAEVAFGTATDTQDATGRVIARGENYPTRAQIEAALPALTGEIRQRPSMYSAIKREGTPLYALARRGEEVEVPERVVRVDALRLMDETERRGWMLHIRCGRGTYVRSICHDLGTLVGCPAHMRFLLRSQSGFFTLDSAMTLEEAQAAADAGILAQRMIPLDAPLGHMNRAQVPARLEKLARNGGKLPARALRFDAPPAPGEAVRIYLSEAFWGIACLREDQLVWRAQIPPET